MSYWRKATLAVCVIAAGVFAFNAVLSRVKISASAVVEGKRVAGEWILPTSRYRYSAAYWEAASFFSRLVPSLSKYLISERATRIFRPPFSTVFLPSPDNGALGVDLYAVGGSHDSQSWLASPGSRSRAIFFRVDSLDDPRILVDYAMPAQGGGGCPESDPVFLCQVSTSVSYETGGPLKVDGRVGGSNLLANRDAYRLQEELRQLKTPQPLMFISQGAVVYQPSNSGDPVLSAFMRSVSRTAILELDMNVLKRVRESGVRGHIYLRYQGENSWALPASPNDLLLPGSLTTFYRTSVLTLADSECCSWPDMAAAPLQLGRIAGRIHYGDHTLDFDPLGLRPTANRALALVDPGAGIILLLRQPYVKAIWMTSP